MTVSLARSLAACFPLVLAQDGEDARRFWPQWRGPLGTGEAPLADPPVRWSEVENVRWKVALPGDAHSSPVVWGDRVFLTTAVPFGDPVAMLLPRPTWSISKKSSVVPGRRGSGVPLKSVCRAAYTRISPVPVIWKFSRL